MSEYGFNLFLKDLRVKQSRSQLFTIFQQSSSRKYLFQGLRITGLIGAVLTGIGSFVKVFSVGRDLYYVVLIGQTVTAISQLFILSLPPKIAVTWFSPKEVSHLQGCFYDNNLYIDDRNSYSIF